MMKQTRILALVAATALTISGCAGTEDTGPGNSGEFAAAPGFDPNAKTIKVGVLNPFSGPLTSTGESVLLGAKLYVDKVNQEGGIGDGYKVELVTADSAANPQTALSAYAKLADEVVMLGSVFGTGVTKALAPQAATDDVLMIPVSSSSEWLRTPNTMPVTPHYEATAINALAYAAENVGTDANMCSLVADDPLGESFLPGIEYVVEEMDLNYPQEVRFPVDSTDFTPQISKLKSADCEVVFLGGTNAVSVPAMSSAAQLDFEPQWVTFQGAFTDNVLNSPVGDYVTKNWWIFSPMAPWGDRSVPAMDDLMGMYEAQKTEGTKSDMMLGFQFAQAFTQLLEKAVEAGDLSQKSLLELSQTEGTLTFDGLSPDLTTGPADSRQAPTAQNVYTVDASVEGGLKRVEANYDSKAAEGFKIK